MLMHERDIGFLILSHFALRPWLAVCVQWRPETSSCIQRSVAVVIGPPSHPAASNAEAATRRACSRQPAATSARACGGVA
jgi:hypothetical protein